MNRLAGRLLLVWFAIALCPTALWAQSPSVEKLPYGSGKMHEGVPLKWDEYGVFTSAEWAFINSARTGSDPAMWNKATTICSEKCKICTTGTSCDFDCAAKKCGNRK
jgi:hypothetical protein